MKNYDTYYDSRRRAKKNKSGSFYDKITNVTSSSFLKFNYTATSNTALEAVGSIPSGGRYGLCGNFDGAWNSGKRIYVGFENVTQWDFAFCNKYATPYGATHPQIYKLKVTKSAYFVDDVQKGTFGATFTPQVDKEFHIFGVKVEYINDRNIAGTIIEEVNIYESSTQTRAFRPFMKTNGVKIMKCLLTGEETGYEGSFIVENY